MSGDSASGRASRPSAQAPAGLGDTATIPDAATFHVGKYKDGSGAKFRVRYDVSSDYIPDCVWIDVDDYSDTWLAVNWMDAEDLITAIRAAAQAIEARRGETERLDPQDESAVRQDAPEPAHLPQKGE